MNNNEINLERLTDNIWHIHAVYQRLVRENKIYPSTADGCESLRNFELETITKMAIEFDKNWGEYGTELYSDAYRDSYEDAIQIFAEERLKELFGCPSVLSKIDYIVKHLERILDADKKGAKIFTEGEGGIHGQESLYRILLAAIDLNRTLSKQENNKGDRK